MHVPACNLTPTSPPLQNLTCPRGETCPYAHNVFEYRLHPSRYRTSLCNDGVNCKRKVCFFAHTLEELRVPSCKPVLPDSPMAAGRQDDTDSGFPIQGHLGGSEQGLASRPAGAAFLVSTLDAGNEMWDNSAASVPTSTWSPYTQAMSYPDHHPTDASTAALLSARQSQSPAGNIPDVLEQLAQTLAACNLTTATSGEQALADILNLLRTQQLSVQNDEVSTPAQTHGMPPASAAVAAAASLGQQPHGHRMSGHVPTPTHEVNFALPQTAASQSSCILSSAWLDTAPAPYHQSSLYSPSIPTVTQLQQADYAVELESMRRRSLDSAMQAMHSRTLSAQQAHAAANQRRSLDTYVTPAANYGHAMQQQQRWPSTAQNTIAMAQLALQQQQLHVQQAQQQKQYEQEQEVQKLLHSAQTSALQELQNNYTAAASLSVLLSANMDAAMSMQSSNGMFGCMLANIQQQQQ
jgi:hypothetical protein